MIQLNPGYFDNLTGEKISELLMLIQPYFEFRNKLYNRYRRKVYDNQFMSSEEERVTIAFEYYIVHMVQGYLSGKAPSYSVVDSDKSEDFQAAIDNIRRYNDDAATFTELIHDYIVTGAAYLNVLENEDNEVVYTRADSRQSICIYDYNTPPYPIAFLRRFMEYDDKGIEMIRLEVITENYKRIYSSDGLPIPFVDYNIHGELQLMDERPVEWGDVPVTSFENPDSIGIFEPVIGVIDMYENMIKNIKNMTQYNDDAKLLIAGYNPSNPMFVNVQGPDGAMIMNEYNQPVREVNPVWKQEEKELFDAKAVFLREGGNMQWLIKNVNYSGMLDVLKKLETIITMISNVPNMTDESFAGNASGVALGYKLYGLDQYAAVIDKVFKRGYLRLWEIITNRLNIKNNTSFDFRKIDVTFTRNIPTDVDVQVARAIKAKDAGLLSAKSAINEAGLKVDPEGELTKINADQIRPSKPEQIVELRNNQLISEEYALQLLYGEEIGVMESERLAEEDLSMNQTEQVISDTTLPGQPLPQQPQTLPQTQPIQQTQPQVQPIVSQAVQQ